MTTSLVRIVVAAGLTLVPATPLLAQAPRPNPASGAGGR